MRLIGTLTSKLVMRTSSLVVDGALITLVGCSGGTVKIMANTIKEFNSKCSNSGSRGLGEVLILKTMESDGLC